jgi:hypothetical protein
VKLRIIDGMLKIKIKIKNKNQEYYSRLVPTAKMTFINVESRMNPLVFRKDDAGKVSGLLVAKRLKLDKIQ